MIEVVKGSTYYLEMFITNQIGDPVTGLTITYKIYYSATNVLLEEGTLDEIGNGVYQKSVVFNNLGQHRVIYTTPTNYTDEIESIMVIEEKAKEGTLLRVLGLSQENYRLFDTVYVTIGVRQCLTSGKIRIYQNADDCNNDINPIAEYQITASYNANGLMTSYKVVKL